MMQYITFVILLLKEKLTLEFTFKHCKFSNTNAIQILSNGYLFQKV